MRSVQMVAAVAAIGLLVGVGSALSQQAAQFSDDLAGYAAGSDGSPTWQVVNGKWAVEDGTYVQSRFEPADCYSYLKEPVVSDFTLSARFYVFPDGAGVKAPGLVFRSQSSAEHYFTHYDTKNSQMILYLSLPGGEFRELARVPGLQMPAEQWHTAKVTCTGPHISMYLDDKLISEVDDSTFLVGRVGLRTGQGKIAYDDVKLEGTPASLDKEWAVMPESVVPDESDIPKLEAAEHVVAERGGGYFPVLIELNDGRIAAVVRGGAPHIGIKGRLDWIESSDGGATWSAPKVIVDGEWDDRNPAMGQMADGTIVMAYAEMQMYNEKGEFDTSAGPCVLYYVLSKDGGKTWSERRRLHAEPIGTDASPFGKISVLQDGTAIMSVYGNIDKNYAGPVNLPEGVGPYIVGLLRSHDNGATWEDFSLVSPGGHNETTLLGMPDGTLFAELRTDGGAIDQSISTDGGRTWGEPAHVTRGSQHPPDIMRLKSGALLLVYGNRLVPFGVGAILSDDGGKTWQYDKRVMLGWTSLGGDCGYPSVVQLDDGTIVCMYYSVGTQDLPDDQQALVVRFTEEQLRKAAGL